MKRAMVAVSDVVYFGGAGSSLLEFLVWARDGGWDVLLAAPEGELAARARGKGFDVVTIAELRIPAGPRSVGVVVAAIRAFRVALILRKVARGRDLVVADGLFVLPSARLARLPCPVVHVSRSIVERRDWSALLRVFGGVAVETIAMSEAAARPYRRFGFAVRVVPHGARQQVESAHLTDPPVIGIAAQLTPLKGQDVLLEAVALLRRRDVVVEFAGGEYPKDRSYVNALRRRAEQPDLAGRVRFLGHIDNALERMRSWRIAALPSVYPETFGLAVVEAMSLGVPVVATDHGGPREVLDGAGLLVPPGDEVALANAMARLLDDTELYARCSRAGRRRVADELNVDRERTELLGALDAAVVGGRS